MDINEHTDMAQLNLVAGDMECPDRAALEGMQHAGLRALCQLHKVTQKIGGRSKTKAEIIDSLVRRLTGVVPWGLSSKLAAVQVCKTLLWHLQQCGP